MRLPVFVTICSAMFLVACSNREEQRIGTLADIRFPDPERKAIAENGIAHIVAYDTGFLFKKYPALRAAFGRINYRWDKDTDYFWGLEMTRSLYDKFGNRTYFWRNDRMELISGCDRYPHTNFDAQGWPISNWLVYPKNIIDTSCYLLKLPNQMLKIEFTCNKGEFGLDTIRYTFDANCHLVMSTHAQGYLQDSEWVYADFDTTWYEYDDNRLTCQRWHYRVPEDSVQNANYIQYYFYKNGHLDSTYSTFEYPSDPYDVQAGRHDYTKYDHRGLPLRGVIFDSIHVFYRYKKHGDPTIPDYSGW